MSAELGGADVTDHLIELLAGRGVALVTDAERDVAERAKRGLAYVAADFGEEMVRATETKQVEREFEMFNGTKF